MFHESMERWRSLTLILVTAEHLQASTSFWGGKIAVRPGAPIRNGYAADSDDVIV